MTRAAKEITLTLMTAGKPSEESAGVLALPDGVKVLYDAKAFMPVVEEVKLDDAKLRSSWGDRIYRVLLKAANPSIGSQWKLRIVSAPQNGD